MKIFIVIPAYNEAENIDKVINDIREHCPQSMPVVINDGSTDNTSSIAQLQGVRVINHPYNLGIGGAVQTGFIIANREGYDTVIQFDGDVQHIAEEIKKILAPLTEGFDIVIGSRFLGISDYPMTFLRRVGTRVFARVLSLICGQELTDTTSGFRAYGKRAVELFSTYYPEDYPEVEALVIAHKKKLNIKEVPVRIRPRSGGRSSITPLGAIYYMIKVLLAVFVDLLKK